MSSCYWREKKPPRFITDDGVVFHGQKSIIMGAAHDGLNGSLKNLVLT